MPSTTPSAGGSATPPKPVQAAAKKEPPKAPTGTAPSPTSPPAASNPSPTAKAPTPASSQATPVAKTTVAAAPKTDTAPVSAQAAEAIKARSTASFTNPSSSSPSAAPSTAPSAGPSTTPSTTRSAPSPTGTTASSTSTPAAGPTSTPSATRLANLSTALGPSPSPSSVTTASAGSADRTEAETRTAEAAASEAAAEEKALRLTQLNPASTEGIMDSVARSGVNVELLTNKAYEAALADGRLRTLPVDKQMTSSEEAAFRLRIDTKGLKPEEIRLAVSKKIADVNGLSLPADATQAQISRANFNASMKWLAQQSNSGITASATDPNFEKATYTQMLDGYKKVFGMAGDASWADVMEEWQKRNQPRATAAGLTEAPQTFYERTSGLTAFRAANNPVSPGPQVPPANPSGSDPSAISPPNPVPPANPPSGIPPTGGAGTAETTLPGDFGRRAALSAQQDPKIFDKGLSITDPNAPKKADFFAYAETDLARFDTNKDGSLSGDEFNTVFAKAILDEKQRQTIASKFFTALDANQDKSINVVENVAQIWSQMGLSDDAPQQMQVTNKGMESLSQMIMADPEMVRQLLSSEITSQGFNEAYQTYLQQLEAANKAQVPK